jgi:hypothetical protein
VRVHCGEGVATHTGPESCVDDPRGRGEALTGDPHRPAIEPRKSAPGCRRRRDSGRQHGGWRKREPLDDPARSETLACVHASCAGTGRSRGRPQAGAVWSASGRHRAEADDARPREVGQVRSTKEVPEQGRAIGSGGDGRKAPGRGETSRQSTDRTQSRVSCPTRRLVRLCRCMGHPDPDRHSR